MLLEFFILFFIGITFLIVALSISRGNIRLIHEYHRKNIKEEDIKPYCALFGKGTFTIAMGIIISSIFALLECGILIIIANILGFVIGMIFLHKAQIKYNGSWIS